MYYLAKNPRTYASDGVINLQASFTQVFVGGASATALTLPDGATIGDVVIVQASTAQAHTVTNTTGFNAGGTGNDVATFGGAIGDGFMATWNGTNWITNFVTNVTIA